LFHGPDSPGLLAALPGTVRNTIGAESRGTVIICPGGNYEFLVPHEGFPAVDWLAQHGIRAFVLRYRLLPNHSFDDMLQDLANAVGLVRRTFEGPVAAMGFSAGGHLVASLALRTKGKKALVKPLDAQVLVYPCIDGSDWGHPEWCGFFDWPNSFPAARSVLVGRRALLGGRGFAAPATFLVASTADESSPPKEHTDKYAKALKQALVQHVYLRQDFGAHGFGLAGGWTPRCIRWLRKLGFGAKASSL
jgi:acetyl esterase/lipase